jgi:hypothetical protein
LNKDCRLSAYCQSITNGEFRQGEIISDVVQYEYNSLTGETEVNTHNYVILVQQDCDLVRENREFVEGRSPVLNGILLIPLVSEAALRESLPGSDVMRRIRQHQQERYYALASAREMVDLQALGLPELFADFRILFSITPMELRNQLNGPTAKRRCFLSSPYKEHFQTRFCGYLQRVALPDA